MNCSSSESRRLQRLLSRLWQELRGSQAASNSSSWWPGRAVSASPAGGAQAQEPGRGEENDAYLYILLIMIFYGCLAGGLILAYTRSRKLESKHDPYHLYIERDWMAAGGRGWAAAAVVSAGEATLDGAHAERRSSGESELL